AQSVLPSGWGTMRLGEMLTVTPASLASSAPYPSWSSRQCTRSPASTSTWRKRASRLPGAVLPDPDRVGPMYAMCMSSTPAEGRAPSAQRPQQVIGLARHSGLRLGIHPIDRAFQGEQLLVL